MNKIAQRTPAKQGVRAAADLNKPLPQSFSDDTVATPGSRSRSSTHGARHDRWCTTREHKSVITTYHGFAKHEKEHENYYVFLPQGPIESTRWGQQQCALCEEINPSKAHLQHHDIAKYDGCLGKPETRSRRGNFEDLLKRHKASSEKIKELLHKWRVVGEKKAYSCGFCISFFRTLSDRTSHIDREHYAKGKHVNDWNNTFVIKGLLLQEEVKEECLKYFHPVDPTAVETEVSWPPTVIEDLQLRLELREEPPQALAIDVFRQASSRGALPPRSTVVPGLRSPSDLTEQIQMSPSTQVLTNTEKVSLAKPFQSPNQEEDSLERPKAQHQAYGSDQNTMETSLISVSLPSSDPQLLGISPGFPAWMDNTATNTNDNASFAYSTANSAYETVPLSPSSRVAPDNPLFHQSDQVGVNETNSPENPYLKWLMPGFNVFQPSSFSVSASEAASHRAAQGGLYHDHISQLTLEPSTTAQLPKRKLSDKSSQDANLKAPTQAPMSKFSSQYPTHSCETDT